MTVTCQVKNVSVSFKFLFVNKVDSVISNPGYLKSYYFKLKPVSLGRQLVIIYYCYLRLQNC